MKYCPFALLVFGVSAHAGVTVDGTRFIFDADKPSITFTVNNTAQQRYLVLSKVLDSQGQSGNQVPFITTPPLFPLLPGHSNIVRIMRMGGDLPDDRESLFWLSVASIPETQSKPTANALQIAIRSRMKLFYRPVGLKGREEEAYRQLLWKAQGSKTLVSNPTPYYVTLVNLRVNDRTVENAGMVAPFASEVKNICPTSGRCVLQWQTINDYGRVMPIQTQTLR
ncbi:fimbrial biogenesis chaperone [Kluyvera sp. CHPC 1.251]|uniref:fimbrial biogenesis chaperone n=1 Tax=Kluyvera sp. CHPC 1.251 TaxID=2995175 RepID=UPI002FD8575A